MLADALIDIGYAAAAVTAIIGAVILIAKLPPVRWVLRHLVSDPMAGWFRVQVREEVAATAEAVGVPNGSGNVVQMLEDLLVGHGELKADVADVKAETRKNRAEIAVTRGMLEAETINARDHRADDQDNFAKVFAEQARVAEALRLEDTDATETDAG